MKIKNFYYLLILTAIFFSRPVFAKTYNVYISWQSNNYSSANYQAKNLSNSGARIKITAMIVDQNNSIVNPKKIKFYWRVNNQTNFFDYSTRNYFKPKYLKQSITIADTRISNSRPLIVEVFVKDYYNNNGYSKINIPFLPPKIEICQNRSVIEKESVFIDSSDYLYPKFIYLNKFYRNNLKYTWLANNEEISNSQFLPIKSSFKFPLKLQLIIYGPNQVVLAKSKEIYLYPANKK